MYVQPLQQLKMSILLQILPSYFADTKALNGHPLHNPVLMLCLTSDQGFFLASPQGQSEWLAVKRKHFIFQNKPITSSRAGSPPARFCELQFGLSSCFSSYLRVQLGITVSMSSSKTSYLFFFLFLFYFFFPLETTIYEFGVCGLVQKKKRKFLCHVVF